MPPSVNQSHKDLFWWRGTKPFRLGLQNSIRHGSFRIRNFGDHLSPFLVSWLSGSDVVYSEDSGKLLAIGSILHYLQDDDIVWGSGLLDPADVTVVACRKRVNIRAVRGPDTRNELLKAGIECPAVFGDPAFLLPHLVKDPGIRHIRVGLAPHYKHWSWFRARVPVDKSIRLINVQGQPARVLSEILACEVILSSSLHGVIVAEAYGIPALTVYPPFVDTDSFLFKFRDYAHSTNRELTSAAVGERFDLKALLRQVGYVDRPTLDVDALVASFPYRAIRRCELLPKVDSGSSAIRDAFGKFY